MLVAAGGSRRRRKIARAVLTAAGPVLPRVDSPKQPVFILGSPRSGTTLLFEILKHSPRLSSLPGESHLLGELFHPSEQAGTTSHELGRDDVLPGEAHVLHWVVDRIAAGRRYLDKAPRNSLRIGYLHALYPDAWFVFLRRDGRAAVSSLMTAWRSETGMFVGMPMPHRLSVRGYGGHNWKFVIPRGWEAYAEGHTLAEVCAFQWRACNEAILEARSTVGSGRWVEVAYEDLVTRPEEEIERLMTALGLPADRVVLDFAKRSDRHVAKAVTDPRPGKWRAENPDDVEAVLPMIAPTMRKLGYDLDE
jgi:hypothetical protein